jgi:hypothetical protein
VRNDTWILAASGLRVGLEMTLGLAVVAVLATITTAHPNQQPSSDILVAGCLNRPSQNGSLAASPGVQPATPATSDQLANLSVPTDAFVLNGATTRVARSSRGERSGVQKASPPRLESYVLHGARDQLAAHLGHQVEVNGTVRITDAQGATASHIAHIDVRGIRLLATSCPKPRTSPDK